MEDDTFDTEGAVGGVEYDTSFSSAISGSFSAISTEGCSDIQISKTQKTESHELSLLEVFEDEAKTGTISCSVEDGSSKMNLDQIMTLLEEESGGAGSGVGGTCSKMNVPEILNFLEIFENYEKENGKHTSLISDLKTENVKLSLELESIKEREKKSHEKHLEEVNTLRVQISSLKLNLQNSDVSLSESHRAELNELRNESVAKSIQIVELSKEINNLKKNPIRSKSAPGKPFVKNVAFEEKEAEYQKEIKRLQKQVRTLQRILYSKEPGVPPIPFNEACMGGSTEDVNANGVGSMKEICVLESRIAELEAALESADAEAKAKIKEFQEQLSSLRERERQSQEKHTEIVNRLKEEMEQLKAAYDTSTESPYGLLLAESEELKSELEAKCKHVSRLQNELSKIKNSRPLRRGDSAQPIDKTTQMLLDEKEVDHQKTVRKLSNQVRTLQRILYHKDPSSLPVVMNLFNPKDYENTKEHQNENDERQRFLECRVAELENQLKQHPSTKSKSELTGKGDTSCSNTEKEKSCEILVGELRARLVSQMKLVTCLKDHLGASKSQVVNLQNEKGLLEFRIRELSQELTLAKTLSKPENEILATLTETVQSLNSRFFYREKELESLITRLSVKNMTNSIYLPQSHQSMSHPLIDSSNIIKSNDEKQLAILLGNDFYHPNSASSNGSSGRSHHGGIELGIFSPKTAIRLLGENVDEFLLNKR